VIGEDEVLRTFSTPEHVVTIEKFRELDGQFQNLTAAYIAAKLAGSLPNSDDIKRTSSWGVLRHELQKKTRHKPVRQLIQEIPDVVTTLAPCLMMSPLSVAQYLPAEQALFDVIIFDEASQITVWDAVGSLARGRQAIVAGDPKQMPPTNFFARADDDPDGEVDVEGDLESILDEMLGASIPQRTLNLHYRSRRESLIAFSNSRYYDNGLITFPAPIHPDHGVRLIRPDGFYARGKARHNEGEAKAIVSEVLRRLTHRDPEVRKQSIGVVTFNSEQQSLIENLLDDARSKNPHIEWAFSTDNTQEPVFVKNLETVQGDERDVILFSVTYGPDQGNHVTMNFGPLNRNGGERRLNVAMTRARSEMLVFSTLSPDRIDLSRTQARAVADLKHFLEYAERGPSALGAAVHGPIGDFESPFESAVARALRDKGWNVHPQVGVSAYRIDLGVVHPDKPGVYLAGVECDGAMYHSSAFARERDKIRQAVLAGLGWTLFRVWSTDWWTHRAKALDTLHEALMLHLEAERKKREEAAQALEKSLLYKMGDIAVQY
jgi:very-short-patch-repair endonuclease